MNHPKLKNPPIQEAIISVQFCEEVDMSVLQSFVQHETVQSKYSVVSPSFKLTIDTSQVTEGSIKANSKQAGFSLRNEAQKPEYVVQMRLDSVSIHIISGYTEFEQLLSAFKEIWQVIVKVGSQTPRVCKLSLRYVNALPIEPLPDFVTLRVTSPFENTSEDFFLQTRVNHKEDKRVLATVIETSQINELTGERMLHIDIDTTMTVEVDLSDLVALEYFSILRIFKNDVFFSILTREALTPYL